jgi:hypothetical protein
MINQPVAMAPAVKTHGATRVIFSDLLPKNVRG